MSRRGNHIENEQAYEAAIARRIQMNKRKTGRAKWFAAFEDAQTVYDWLFGLGEFESGWVYDDRCEKIYGTDYDGNPELIHVDHIGDEGNVRYNGERCNCKWIDHPLSFYSRGDFLSKMRDTIDNWGGLTEGQHLAVRKSFESAKEKLAGRDEARAAKKIADADGIHVGTVGERRMFTVTVERVFTFDGQFGTTYINITRDSDNNIIVYKGTNRLGENGAVVTMKATIKEHGVRDDIKQTVVARPTIAVAKEEVSA